MKFRIYLLCLSKGCTQDVFSSTHLRGEYRNPFRAWRKLRQLRKEYWQSEYFMVAGL